MLLFTGFSAVAQLVMPDYVYIGSTKHYHVNPNAIPGSTYLWSIDGILLGSSITNEIDITWNYPGTFLLEVQEQSLDGCSGLVSSGQVIVSASLPTATITGNSSICQGEYATLLFTMTGVPPYTLLYTDGMTVFTLTGLTEDMYLLTIQPQVSGIYSLISVTDGTGLTNTGTGTAIINVHSLAGFLVTGGGEGCFGSTIVHVGLSGSQLGVTYYVSQNDDVILVIPGSGSQLDFGLITQSGTYTVTAIDSSGCSIEMNGQAEVIIHPKPEAILLSETMTVCTGDSALLWINTISGTGPYTYTFTTDDSSFSIIGDTAGFIPVWVHPNDTTTYTLQYVQDAYCINYGSGTSTVNVVTCTPDPTYTLSGFVRYNNAASMPMNNTTLILSRNNLPLDSTTSDLSGYYHFENLLPGTYQLTATSSKAWGGVNATDALIIMNHFVRTYTLQGIRLAAADVNHDGFVNSIDALSAGKRFVGMINSFPAGDWVFENPAFTITSNNVNIDILALCYGDVNGSYQPPLNKESPTVSLITSGILEIHSFDLFEVPLITNLNQTPGAISLVLNYPATLFDLLYVNLGDLDNSSVIFKAENGEVRIAWYAPVAQSYEPREGIIRLGFKANRLQGTETDELNINIDAGCEFADIDGNLIQNVILQTPQLVYGAGIPTLKIYPNPTNGIVRFEYYIPEQGMVSIRLYDMMGNAIATLRNDRNESGMNDLMFNTSHLPPGMYTCRITITGLSSVKTLSGRLEVVR